MQAVVETFVFLLTKDDTFQSCNVLYFAPKINLLNMKKLQVMVTGSQVVVPSLEER